MLGSETGSNRVRVCNFVFCAAAVVCCRGVVVEGPVEIVWERGVGADIEGDVEGVRGEGVLGLSLGIF